MADSIKNQFIVKTIDAYNSRCFSPESFTKTGEQLEAVMRGDQAMLSKMTEYQKNFMFCKLFYSSIYLFLREFSDYIINYDELSRRIKSGKVNEAINWALDDLIEKAEIVEGDIGKDYHKEILKYKQEFRIRSAEIYERE